jgi:hypothetical protein
VAWYHVSFEIYGTVQVTVNAKNANIAEQIARGMVEDGEGDVHCEIGNLCEVVRL